VKVNLPKNEIVKKRIFIHVVSMSRKNPFVLFGSLQSITLGVIVFLVFESLNAVSERVVGLDTQILLSFLFPLFLFIVEYQIFSKDTL
jgi:hypothetical protein